MNNISLIGRLTNEPEKRTTTGGTTKVLFRFAENGHRPNDNPLFIDVVVFGKVADAIAEHIHKGREIGLNGQLEYRQWEHEGKPRSRYEIVARTIDFLRGAESSPAATIATASDSQAA